MKLQIAAIALSATLVACGGGSGDGGLDETDIDGVPVIGGGEDIDDEDFIDGDDLLDPDDTFADGCEGGSGTDLDSSTPEWDDNCRLQVGGEHQISSYSQGVQRIVFCRGHDQGLEPTEINSFADGNFGPITAEEVRNFQEAEGIAADGIVGPETWGVLQEVLEFLGTEDAAQRDAWGVLPGTCAGVVQFYQDNIDGVQGGWTMAQTPGNPDAIAFSVGPPN